MDSLRLKRKKNPYTLQSIFIFSAIAYSSKNFKVVTTHGELKKKKKKKEKHSKQKLQQIIATHRSFDVQCYLLVIKKIKIRGDGKSPDRRQHGPE